MTSSLFEFSAIIDIRFILELHLVDFLGSDFSFKRLSIVARQHVFGIIGILICVILVQFVVLDDLLVDACELHLLTPHPTLGRSNSEHGGSRWLLIFGHDSLPLLNLHELSPVPGEFLGHVIVVSDIVDVDEFGLQDCIEDEFVVNVIVTSQVKVVIRTVPELVSLLILVFQLFGGVKEGVIDRFRDTIPCFHDALLSIWHQVHVLNVRPGTIKIDEILLVHAVIQV